jgi:hypothetical protein
MSLLSVFDVTIIASFANVAHHLKRICNRDPFRNYSFRDYYPLNMYTFLNIQLCFVKSKLRFCLAVEQNMNL